MVDLPVPVLRLADAAVGEGVSGVIGIHAEVEVVTGVSHGKLEERIRELAKRSAAAPSTRTFSFRNSTVTRVLIYCGSFAVFPGAALANWSNRSLRAATACTQHSFTYSSKQALAVNSINTSTLK